MKKKKSKPVETPWTFSECVLRVVIGRPEDGKLVYRTIDGKIADMAAATWEDARKQIEDCIAKGAPPTEAK